MIIPRNEHPHEHNLYEKVCFSHNGKTYFGQVCQITGQGIYKKYKIMSWTDDLSFNVWLSASSILEDRRHERTKVKHNRRNMPFNYNENTQQEVIK
jgi:hypothetical protein